MIEIQEEESKSIIKEQKIDQIVEDEEIVNFGRLGSIVKNSDENKNILKE